MIRKSNKNVKNRHVNYYYLIMMMGINNKIKINKIIKMLC